MTSIAPGRFVILHHQVGSEFGRTDHDHFDWMFETGPTLLTFATAVINENRNAFEVTCHRLPEHRIEYLDFEGRIPDRGDLRDRGSVRRIALGTFEAINATPDLFLATLFFDSEGKKTADVEFRKGVQQQWSLKFVGSGSC